MPPTRETELCKKPRRVTDMELSLVMFHSKRYLDLPVPALTQIKIAPSSRIDGRGGAMHGLRASNRSPASLAVAGARFHEDMMRDFNLPGRSAAVAANGMVATSAPMATLAGIEVLRAGGNAMDAAIAAVAMQCVVEPQSTGIGGDCFVLYSTKGALPVALNGSGRAPGKATVEWYAERQMRELSTQTAHAVTIPGAIDAWCTLNQRYGSKPLAELLEPAAQAARSEERRVGKEC